MVKQTMEMISTEDMPGPAARAGRAREDGDQGGLRQAEQAHLRQRQGVGPLRHHPDAAGAQEPDRDRGQALRHGGQALPGGVLPAGRVHGHDAHLDGEGGRPGAQVPDQRQGDGQAGLAGGVRPEVQEDDANLVAVAPGEVVRTESVAVNALKTKPPARYTEATLLSAMEGAGKLIDDDELREAMAEKGLGTPATRAAIIEGLIIEKYMHREGRELVPTAKAFQLMTLLRGLGVEDLTKPELTGNWEYQLAEMEKGRLEREAFMAEIAAMAERIVRKAKEYDRDTIPGDYATLTDAVPELRRRGEGELPPLRLHRQVGRRPKAAASRSARSPAGAASSSTRSSSSSPTRRSARSRASAPRRAGRSPPSSSSRSTTRSRTGSSSSTSARTPRGEGESASRSTSRRQESLGACPKCQGHVYEHGTSYVCEHAVGAPRHLRLQERQDHPAAAGGARADEQAAGHRQDRPAGELRLQQDAAQVQGASWPSTRRKAR